MSTKQKVTKINNSLKLQYRTLKNLESMELCDCGATIQLTKNIIANLEACKRILALS